MPVRVADDRRRGIVSLGTPGGVDGIMVVDGADWITLAAGEDTIEVKSCREVLIFRSISSWLICKAALISFASLICFCSGSIGRCATTTIPRKVLQRI